MSVGADFDLRVDIAMAVQRYLRAKERFETASNGFNEACGKLRLVFEGPSRFLVKIDHKHYLVSCNASKDFEVEEIDCIL